MPSSSAAASVRGDPVVTDSRTRSALLPFKQLTTREREVAVEVCRRGSSGRFPTMPDVAKRLGCAVSTARAHLNSIAMKLPNPHGLPAQRLVQTAMPTVHTDRADHAD